MSTAAMVTPPAPVIPIGPHAAHAARTVGAPAKSPLDPRALQVVPASAGLAVRPSAVVPVNRMEAIEQHPRWSLLSRLPIRMSAGIPLPHFKVRDLLALKEGELIHSVWETAADVLLKADEIHVCWAEFEVVEQSMAVRITRLA